MQHLCLCSCHAPADEERDASSAFYGVSMSDEIALHTAPPCCANEHWRVFYFATEPAPPVPTEEEPYVDPPSPQADGWKG